MKARLRSCNITLTRNFFQRSPDIVAQELLGNIIVHKIGKTVLSGKIVETESYFGENDPSSRAYKRKSENFYTRMSGTPGVLLIYMVHNNWLLNFVAHEKREVGAVLLRGIEPLKGIDIMKKNRGKEVLKTLTDGPGKLTCSFGIDKSAEGVDSTKRDSRIFVISNKETLHIERSGRIGVKVDLPGSYRFYVKGNPFVSR